MIPGNSNNEIKRRTGFLSEQHLLSHVVLVCNGDLELMFKSKSKLTWYEECFLYFEIVWGKQRDVGLTCAVKIIIIFLMV